MSLKLPGCGVNLSSRGQSEHSTGGQGGTVLQWEVHPGGGLKVGGEGLLPGATAWT